MCCLDQRECRLKKVKEIQALRNCGGVEVTLKQNVLYKCLHQEAFNTSVHTSIVAANTWMACSFITDVHFAETLNLHDLKAASTLEELCYVCLWRYYWMYLLDVGLPLEWHKFPYCINMICVNKVFAKMWIVMLSL